MNQGQGLVLLYLLDARQFGDHFVAVALVDEETLALGGIVHFHRVLRHERVEIGVVLFGCWACRRT